MFNNPKPQPNPAGQALGLALIAGMLFAGTHAGTPAPKPVQELFKVADKAVTAIVPNLPAAKDAQTGKPVQNLFQAALVAPAAPAEYQTYAAETEQPELAAAFNDAYPDTNTTKEGK